ncbi:MAG: FG-GAP-like repeat-containing protein, partial [bacterium]
LDLTQFAPRPQIVDLNADNAKDLIAGAGSILDYFENTGDSSSAQLVFLEQGYQGINESGIQPYFVDIDADGDYDLFCGTSAIPGPPPLALYLNQGTPGNPVFQLYSSQFVTNPGFFVVILPVLADIDADGDYDLFIFDDMDHFYYYQNNGTPQWPDFDFVTNQWQGIHQFPYPYDSWYGFSFADLDDDLDLDLLIGSPEQNNLYFYRNQGTPQSPQMVLATETLLPGSYPYIYTPYLVDIDADADYDLFVGYTSGGMLFFRNVTGETGVNPQKKQATPYQGPVFTLGPNPANPVTVISFCLPYPQQATLAVYNLLGAKVTTLASGLQPAGEQSFWWSAQGKASGVYIIRLEAGGQSQAKQMVVVK